MSLELLGRSSLAGAGAADAFGRLRISTPVTLFDSQSQYDASPLLLETATTGGASAAHSSNDSTVDLTVGTASGDKVTRQSRQYLRYQPGKSQLILITGAFGTGATNTEKRMGYFDDNNGVFLKEEDGQLSVVLRSSSSGSVVDDEIAQAFWSGQVPSDLDLEKAQIFWIAFEWLGVGQVSCGFNIDGVYYVAHQWNNANNVSTTYMATANLPVRWEMENTGTSAGTSMKAICASVISEGGFEDDRGYPFAASNGTTTISVNARRPILSIRPKATFNSLVNRGRIVVESTEVFADDYPTYVEIIYNGTLTGASFTSVNASSITEYDVSATAISGGIVVDAFFVEASKNSKSAATGQRLLSRLPLSLDIAGANPINLTIVTTTIPNNASDTAGVFRWKEFR